MKVKKKCIFLGWARVKIVMNFTEISSRNLSHGLEMSHILVSLESSQQRKHGSQLIKLFM